MHLQFSKLVLNNVFEKYGAPLRCTNKEHAVCMFPFILIKALIRSIFDVVTLCSGVLESIETVDYNETDTITITTEIIDAGPPAHGDFSY